MERIQTDIAALGGGPGGYAAAFYAADRGLRAAIVEREERLGGVCLNRGCIPSKALIHAAQSLEEAEASRRRGIYFEKPRIELDELRAWKDAAIQQLADGIRKLAKARGVEVVRGEGRFESSDRLRVETKDGARYVEFKAAVAAVGSRPALPKRFDLDHPAAMSSAEALEIDQIPEKMLVIGGGYIGMELGSVYAALGSKVTLIEALDSILPQTDPDLRRPVERRAKRRFQEIRVRTSVLSMRPRGDRIEAASENARGDRFEERYDRVLVSVGRVPNTAGIGLENTAARLDENGFIQTDRHCRTDDPRVYAIGDAAGGPMLAHKAVQEARIAVDAHLGEADADPAAPIVPAVAFTDPEIAWAGLTETEAAAQGMPVEIAKFPWGASGRALTLDKPDGLTKLILEPDTARILGVGIAGHGAGELISEGALAIEAGISADRLARIAHPHPTLSETLKECAEAFYGHSPHTAPRRRKRPR